MQTSLLLVELTDPATDVGEPCDGGHVDREVPVHKVLAGAGLELLQPTREYREAVSTTMPANKKGHTRDKYALLEWQPCSSLILMYGHAQSVLPVLPARTCLQL
jgi:hypothetical protein